MADYELKGKEKRVHERVAVRIPAGIYFKNRPGEVIDAEILDLSEGGAFVHCLTPIKLGEDLLIEIRFGETSFVEGKTVYYDSRLQQEIAENPFKETSSIRWARGSQERGFGIAFEGLSPAKKAFIAKLVRHFSEQQKKEEE